MNLGHCSKSDEKALAVENNAARASFRCQGKENMLKRFLRILAVIGIIFVVGYFIYTGKQI